MDGSITEISASTQLLTWDEACNYTAQRSILDADIIKQGVKSLNDNNVSKVELADSYNVEDVDTASGIRRFIGSTLF